MSPHLPSKTIAPFRIDTRSSGIISSVTSWLARDDGVDAFVRSLPIAGVDGTIENVITDGPAVGNLRAKTGTMTGVRSLSGYITTSTGRPIVFSLMSNHHTVPTSDVNDVQRRLVDLLARL
ncbi:MAG: D-alanyl-D-alanine carboxypeptidase [Acidobacteria bacterium]|nr:D-alanyl-D-alanine carboxypeptidase [Acidobacteriota bacterium]